MKLRNLLVVSSFFITGSVFAIEPVYDGENGIREKVFATNCLFCHASNLTGSQRQGAPSFVNWDTYEATRLNASRAIARAVRDLTMPPASSGIPHLNEEQQTAMLAWQKAGFPKSNNLEIIGTFDFDTAILTLPVVNVGDLKYRATFKLTQLNDSPTGFGFILEGEPQPTTETSGNAATFLPATGQLHVPKVNLINKAINLGQVSAELVLVPGASPLLFSLISYTQ